MIKKELYFILISVANLNQLYFSYATQSVKIINITTYYYNEATMYINILIKYN